jgi:hypothetical protein
VLPNSVAFAKRFAGVLLAISSLSIWMGSSLHSQGFGKMVGSVTDLRSHPTAKACWWRNMTRAAATSSWWSVPADDLFQAESIFSNMPLQRNTSLRSWL